MCTITNAARRKNVEGGKCASAVRAIGGERLVREYALKVRGAEVPLAC